MSEFKKDYKTGAGFSEFIAGVGWLAIVGSIFTGIILFNEAGSFGLVAIPICLATALVGLLLVVAGQSLRAQLDIANSTANMLKIMDERFNSNKNS